MYRQEKEKGPVIIHAGPFLITCAPETAAARRAFNGAYYTPLIFKLQVNRLPFIEPAIHDFFNLPAQPVIIVNIVFVNRAE